MIAAVPYQLTLWWERIVREVRDGTPGGVPFGSPDPARAAELQRLADYFGSVSPAHVWPRIRALFGWTTGVASLYLPALREHFGSGVTALPAPVAASEGPVGVPLDRHGTAGSLVATASVYEFAPKTSRGNPCGEAASRPRSTCPAAPNGSMRRPDWSNGSIRMLAKCRDGTLRTG